LKVSAILSPRLWHLLTDEGCSTDEAVGKILATPGLLDETRQRLAELEEAVKPCGDSFVGAMLSEWTLVYDPGVRSETPGYWAPYKHALEDLPHEAIIGGMRAWEKQPDAEFFPKPGPLRALAKKSVEPLYFALGRARKAVIAPPPKKPLTPMEADERAAFIAEMMQSLRKVGNQFGQVRMDPSPPMGG
jgi:hypothetical protein